MRLIDADAMRNDWLENGQNEYVYDTNAFLQSIDEQPTIEAEPVRHGKWIKKRFGSYVCSECGLIHIPVLSKPNKRCPRCEAKMDGDSE